MARVGRPKKTKYQSIKGMPDLLSGNLKYFQEIFDVSSQIAKFYGFERIETPILEQADLFEKGLGKNTEIFERQMYFIREKREETLALRPEYTTSLARAFIEKEMDILPRPVKLWYFGPCFRYEEPRLEASREFWQLGFEAFGERNPVVDAQIIKVFLNILEELKVKNLLLQINSIGDPKCRAHYKKNLARFLKSYQSGFCSDCKKLLKQDPFRILNCKNEKCQRIISQAPQIVDYFCRDCNAHFREVLELLEVLGVPYRLNPYLVKNIDYYTRTVFEISIGNPSAELNSPFVDLVGGGRYDNLVRSLGGKDTPACGAAAGVERIMESMKKEEFKFKKEISPQIFLVQLGGLAKRKAIVLFEEFQKSKIPIVEAFSKESLRVQLARASRLQARYVLILGQKEAIEEEIILRDVEKGTQRTVKLKNIIKAIKEELRRP